MNILVYAASIAGEYRIRYGALSIGERRHCTWVAVRHGLLEASGGSNQSVRFRRRPLSIERLAGDRWVSYVGCCPARSSVSVVWW